MRSTIRDELDADSPREFWQEVFLRAEAQERIYRELGYSEAKVLEQVGDLDTGLTRRFMFVQPLAAPGPLKRLLGGEQTLLEEGVFDAERGEYRFQMSPTGPLSERIQVRGVTRVRRSGPGKVVRVCELECSCSIPALGGLTERFMTKANEEIYARRTEIERKLLHEARTRA